MPQRLVDEWGNDCPYDFKNVQFRRYRVRDDSADGLLADLANVENVGTTPVIQLVV